MEKSASAAQQAVRVLPAVWEVPVGVNPCILPRGWDMRKRRKKRSRSRSEEDELGQKVDEEKERWEEQE